MKITFISQYFPPEMGAPAARISEHARYWAEDGHDITVITGFPNHPDGVIPENYRGELFRRERVDGIELLRTWLYATPNAGFAKRIANFLSFSASSVLLGSVLTEKPDLVVATSPQFFCGLSGLALSRRFNVPYVLEIRDIWPQSAVELGALRDPSLIRALEAVETMMYRSAARVVIVSESFRSHIRDRGVPDEKIVFIPNGIDPAFLDGHEKVDVRSDYGLEGKFVVGYVGTHGMGQGLTTVLEAADTLREDREMVFLFVGDGAEKADLVAVARQRGLDNVRFLPVQPREQIPAFYQACDICLVPLRDLPIFKTVLPSKMFEIMALGRPMIVGVGGEAERVVSEGDAALCVPPEDPGALAEAVATLRADEEARRSLGERASSFVWKDFSRPVLARRYEALFEEVLGQSQRPSRSAVRSESRA